jgi:hypothetical protein
VAPVISTAVGVMGLVASGCGSTYPGATAAEQVTGWASTTDFTAQARTLVQDARRVAGAVAQHEPALVRTDCDVFVTDALTANQNLPTPDQKLTDLLAGAYASAGDAGRDCLQGAGGNAGLLARSAAERASFERELIRAQARYDSLTTGLALPAS